VRTSTELPCQLISFVIVTLLVLAPSQSHAAGIVLYDGALGGLPVTQGLAYAGFGPTETFTAGATVLNSSANKAFQGGYTPKVGRLPVLDRSRGYTLRFTVQITAEDHAGSDRNSDMIDDRAGFSLIVLSSDRHGIELGFWPNRIWAQAGGGSGDGPIFTQAEGAALDTTTERIYELFVHGDIYQLREGSSIVLSGALRNYSAFGSVYTTPNFMFLGDNTTSASATVRIVRASIEVVPYQVYLPFIR
jgi:hypothetical protein